MRVPTTGEIARRYDDSIYRVEYVIKSRGIRPVGRAGNARIFSENDVARIGEELSRLRESRRVRPASL